MYALKTEHQNLIVLKIEIEKSTTSRRGRQKCLKIQKI